jgi:hypothetical protein
MKLTSRLNFSLTPTPKTSIKRPPDDINKIALYNKPTKPIVSTISKIAVRVPIFPIQSEIHFHICSCKVSYTITQKKRLEK